MPKGAILAVGVIALAYAWKKDKLNKYLPDKLRHKEGFIGLERDSIYVRGPGGKPGVAGIDLNVSNWV